MCNVWLPCWVHGLTKKLYFVTRRPLERFGDTIALFVLPIQLMALKGKLAFAFWQAKGKATAVAAAAAKTPPLVPPPI